MRLIDADKVLERAIPVRGEYDNSLPFEAVPVGYIKGAPTISATLVQHGQWDNCSQISVKCSNCGAIYTKSAAHHYKYCPDCGAKMKQNGE